MSAFQWFWECCQKAGRSTVLAAMRQCGSAAVRQCGSVPWAQVLCWGGATLAPMAKSFDFHNTPGHLVRRAHQRTVALFMEETAGFEVTPVQFAILHELLARPGEDQVTLASRVAFDAATSGSVIGRLEKRGWIRREPDTRDRRRKLLWITPEGEVAALQMRDAAQRVQERLTAPLTAQESADLMVLLSKVVYNHQDPAGTSGA